MTTIENLLWDVAIIETILLAIILMHKLDVKAGAIGFSLFVLICVAPAHYCLTAKTRLLTDEEKDAYIGRDR